MKRRQRGGFFLGVIVGLLIGLALALGVALYISKVPVPFVNKVPQRTAEQDAAEAERNKSWDPNSGLQTRTPVRGSASGVVEPATPATPPTATAPSPAPAPSRDPAAILADQPGAIPTPPAAATAPPEPPAPAGLSTKPADDPLVYFVQAGAYSRQEEAEQQRARLAMLGLTARVTEREQSGRTMYRVRVGPLDTRESAAQTKDRLDAAGIESALVRVQK